MATRSERHAMLRAMPSPANRTPAPLSVLAVRATMRSALLALATASATLGCDSEPYQEPRQIDDALELPRRPTHSRPRSKSAPRTRRC